MDYTLTLDQAVSGTSRPETVWRVRRQQWCLLSLFLLCNHWLILGPGVAQWLRYCATSRAVPGSNPGGVGHRDFSRGYRQNHVPRSQLSKKWVPGIPLGIKAAGACGWRPTTLVVPNVKKSGALTYPDPLGPSRRPVVGETFTFLYIYIYRLDHKQSWSFRWNLTLELLTLFINTRHTCK